MVEMTKPVVATVVINLFLILYGFAPLDGGLIQSLVDTEGPNVTANPDSVSGNLTASIPNSDSGLGTAGGTSGGTFSSFFDSIGVIQDFIVFIVNVIIAPIALFTIAGMPGIVKAVLGVPLLVLNVIAYASFIRSGT